MLEHLNVCEEEEQETWESKKCEDNKGRERKNIGRVRDIYSVVAKMIRTLVCSPAKKCFKSIISIFCCSVSVGNISLYFQTLILPLIVIIQWDFCLTTASAPQRSDLIIISLSGMTWRNRTNWDRLNPEELCQRLQDASRNLPAKLPEKLCSSAPRAKAALNTKDGHTKCWFHLVNRRSLIKKIYLTLFLTASSFYSVFTQVSKTFNSTAALQEGFSKRLGDVGTVLLDLVCLSLFCFFKDRNNWIKTIFCWWKY